MKERLTKRLSQSLPKENPLDSFEQAVYERYVSVFNETDNVPNNRAMADELGVSRNAVARARRRIAHKLGFKKGW